MKKMEINNIGDFLHNMTRINEQRTILMKLFLIFSTMVMNKKIQYKRLKRNSSEKKQYDATIFMLLIFEVAYLRKFWGTVFRKQEYEAKHS